MKKKKRFKETILIAIILVIISLVLFYIQSQIFNDSSYIVSLIFANIAFIPLNTFFTAFIIENLIEKRNTFHKMEKLVMIKGVFFSEFGSELLQKLVKYDSNAKAISAEAHVNKNWGSKEFKKLNRVMDNHAFESNINKVPLLEISNLINKNKDFLLSIITNPVLMEHEIFSDMTVALFHLKEELQDIYINTDCPCCDDAHLRQDIKNLYRLMAKNWAAYMRHLKEEYPALFVKAMIHNPFNRNISL